MSSPAAIAASENYPLHPPPIGQTSNFINPETRGPAVIILCSVFVGIMWPLLLLRLYSKAWVVRKFGWDDGKSEALLAQSWLVLKHWHSLRYACCSVYRHSRNEYIMISKLYQICITANASVLIWCINIGFLGPNEWNVRAVLLTPRVIKVSSLNRQKTSDSFEFP